MSPRLRIEIEYGRGERRREAAAVMLAISRIIGGKLESQKPICHCPEPMARIEIGGDWWIGDFAVTQAECCCLECLGVVTARLGFLIYGAEERRPAA